MQRSSRGAYFEIAGTGIRVWHREAGVWMLCTGYSPTRRWLVTSGLIDARFATRRDALSAFVAHAAITPPPAPARDPASVVPLMRVCAGEHRTRDGRIVVSRAADGWQILNLGRYAPVQPTLRAAAAYIAMALELA
jgi:hypothetical protein